MITEDTTPGMMPTNGTQFPIDREAQHDPTHLYRRMNLELNTPAERAIYEAMQEVEKLPAHHLLTWAVTKLEEARKLVADYVDSTLPDGPKA